MQDYIGKENGGNNINYIDDNKNKRRVCAMPLLFKVLIKK